jgi:hypothetical protein
MFGFDLFVKAGFRHAASALKHLGSFLGDLTASFEQLATAVYHILARIEESIAASLDLAGNAPPRVDSSFGSE